MQRREVGGREGECAAALRFVEGSMPLRDFWRLVDGGSDGAEENRRRVGRALVEADDVSRVIEARLAGRVSQSELSGWAGTVVAFRCFVIASRGVRAAVTRLALSELSDEGLRVVLGKLDDGADRRAC
jgi:hypothetical protein